MNPLRFSGQQRQSQTSWTQIRADSRRSRPNITRRLLTFEGLEGRALLAISPLDPTFNGGQPILTPADSTATTGLNTARAVAIQPNGQIVVVGATNGFSLTGGVGVAVRRYNADGSPDATFGTNGEADLFVPSTLSFGVSPAAQILIQPDGGIVVAAALNPSSDPTLVQIRTLVARLSTTGEFDSSFGVGGETLLGVGDNYTSLALTPDDRIVLAGTVATGTDSSSLTTATAVTRLTSTGSADPTFNGGNVLTFDASNSIAVDGLAVTSQGQTIVYDRVNIGTGTAHIQEPRLHEFATDGTANASFGTSGVVVTSAASNFYDAGAFALQPDGRILVTAKLPNLGPNGLSTHLLRFTATGQLDSTFSNPELVTTPNNIVVGPDSRIILSLSDDHPEVQRYLSNGATDPTLGPNGRVDVHLPPILNAAGSFSGISGLAITPSGQIIAVATNEGSTLDSTPNPYTVVGSQAAILQFRLNNSLSGFNNDYDGDNITDISAAITALGAFGYRKTTGGDVLQSFGAPGVGQVLPAPGDYDGDGKTDIAAYLPALGVLAYRPSSGGQDVYVRFGPAGDGNAIPVPGDYDGDGRTDVALYLPGSGAFAIDPSSGAVPYAVPFGLAGAGQTIPVVADYDGDGKTDLAVYLPVQGEFLQRQSTDPNFTFAPVFFGPAGIGASIPAPGNYFGIGNQFALYLPSSGTFAVYGANTQLGNIAVQFGAAGAGQSIPIPGDYDGDGLTDFAVYLPSISSFAYRSSSVGTDVLQQFGVSGSGQTVPAAALAVPDSTTLHTMSLAAGATEAEVFVPLVDVSLEPAPTTKKSTRT